MPNWHTANRILRNRTLHAAGVLALLAVSCSSDPPGTAGATSPEGVILVSTGAHLITFNLATATVATEQPPEPLLHSSMTTMDSFTVVVGESGAWARGLDGTWTYLDIADAVRPSSHPSRVWLRNIVVDDPDVIHSEFLWTEVDVDAVGHRSTTRNWPIEFGSPELVWGSDSNIFLLDATSSMRSLSDRSSPIAWGRNDLVTTECEPNHECRRIWFNATTGQERPVGDRPSADSLPDHDASTLTADGNKTLLHLSPDGRFVAVPSGTNSVFFVELETNRETSSTCLWNREVSWSSSGEVVACSTAHGVALYDLVTSAALGIVPGSEGVESANFAFLPKMGTLEDRSGLLSPAEAFTAEAACESFFPTLARFELSGGRIPPVDENHSLVYPLAPDDRLILSADDAIELATTIAKYLDEMNDVAFPDDLRNQAVELHSTLTAFEGERLDDAKEADYGLRLLAFRILEFGSNLLAAGADKCSPDSYR